MSYLLKAVLLQTYQVQLQMLVDMESETPWYRIDQKIKLNWERKKIMFKIFKMGR